MKVAVIGGGAAGIFAAISCKTHHPGAEVTVFEKSDKVLAKVKVSGGGRCNVTHACHSNSQLVKFYPRGEKQLKKAFAQFSVADTIKWFESRGVKLKIEVDGRMFPVTDDSQTIIRCLLTETEKLGIKIEMHQPVLGIEKVNEGYTVVERSRNHLQGEERFDYAQRPLSETVVERSRNHLYDYVIIASGGSPKAEGLEWLKKLGHKIETPVPSLFTFNMPDEKIKSLMGVSVENAQVRLQGKGLRSEGPLLITHWGMSGPAILKLSAWGARLLHDLNYHFTLQVNWLGNADEDNARKLLWDEISRHPKRQIANSESFKLPERLFHFLLSKIEIRQDTPLEKFGKKNMNRLLNTLMNDEYKVAGKTTFKEEFVTCGGVSLDSVNMDTMQSKICPGLYFCGEVLDIDGVTGGFNFQSAWTTGFIAGKLKN